MSQFKPGDTVPMWNSIEAGDKVTLRVPATGEVITTTAYHDEDFISTVGVLGVGRDAFWPLVRWELVSIEKPKPALPTKNGSVIIQTGHPAFEIVLVAGRWIWADNGNQTFPGRFNDPAWTLVRDAGKGEDK